MNSQEAKETLMLYRPNTADTEDPSFAEALQLCEQDAELKRWFGEHCSVYVTLRARFREMPIPQGLKEQILAERKIHTAPGWRQRPALIFAGAAILAALVAVPLWWASHNTGSVFVTRMVSTALREYGMLETNNPVVVREFLARCRAPSDYVLPAGLQQAALTGCTTTLWEDKMVSLICFNSGKPHRPGQQADLWLFVADRSAVPGAPATSQPVITKQNRVMTARWSDGTRTYLLVADGDETFLKKFL